MKKRTEKSPTSLEALKKQCEGAGDPSLYRKVLAYRAALNAVREVYGRVDTALEVTKATIRLEI